MLNRRLIVLFVVFVASFLMLGVRLAKLQLVDAAHWQEELRAYVHRNRVIETYRGAILDRNGKVLAQDVACDELVIDYRAMNLDDQWLRNSAIARLKAAGEKIPKGAAGVQRVAQVKEEIAAQIDAIPDAVARVCKMPKEDVLIRFQDIRARIHALRQDLWSQNYRRRGTGGNGADGIGTPGGAEDPELGDLDADFRDTSLKDEVIAHPIVSPLSTEAANYFRAHAEEYPGLSVSDRSNRRDYPYGEAAVHVVGTMRSVDTPAYNGNIFRLPNLLSEADAGKLDGYLPGDDMGESGAERILEGSLRAARGAKLVDLADGGEGAASQESRHVDPTPGKNVRLTIDVGLQKDMFDALKDPDKKLLRGEDGKDHFVGLVVMQMEDGQVLAMVSWPSYDPNTLDQNRKVLQLDTYRTPMVNRVTSAKYQPGSTIKPIWAAAALTDHVITADTVINCPGYLYPNRPEVYKCDAVHGELGLVDAIAKSCDVYFYTVGLRMGLDRMEPWFERYGFGHDTGLELPEARGNYPIPKNHPDADDATREAIFAGIGQGGVTATPLQMAKAYGALLRGGEIVTPRIVMDTPVQRTKVFAISPAVLATVRQGMEGCVTTGTAKDTFKGYRLAVAGKTGTAQTARPAFDDDGNPMPDMNRPYSNTDGTPKLGADGKPQYHQAVRRDDDAWFIGYAPADQPKYLVAAIMEFGGFGGKRAAPMVKEAFTQLQKHGYLPPTDIR